MTALSQALDRCTGAQVSGQGLPCSVPRARSQWKERPVRAPGTPSGAVRSGSLRGRQPGVAPGFLCGKEGRIFALRDDFTGA